MLKIYKNIQPNGDARHYFFNSLTEFETALSSYLLKSVSLDNYRINGNSARIYIDGTTITQGNALSITYLIDDEGPYARCYHVLSAVIQSGYVLLSLSLDEWATYLPIATFSHINVMRSNRRAGVGILDEINATDGSIIKSFAQTTGTTGNNNQYMDIASVYIVFALKYNIQQNSAGSVSRVGLYALNLLTLKTALYNANRQGGDSPTPEQLQNNFNWSLVNPVEFAVDVISGIYGIEGHNQWGITGTLNAAVLGAWFTDNIAVVSQSDLTIKTKPNWKNYTDVTLSPLQVIPSIARKRIVFANDYDKQFYIGSMHNGLKLQRRDTENNYVFISTIPSNDKLTFIISDGDNQLDVTSSFSVVVGMTDGDITAERQALDVVQNSVRAIGSAIALGKGISSGSGFATALNINSMAGSLAAEIGKGRTSHLGNIISGGDGFLAYWTLFNYADHDNPDNNLASPVANPYIINAFYSIDDEDKHARETGARRSITIDALEDIFDYDLIGSGNVDDTYLQASVCVDGLPLQACDYFKNLLAGGLYLTDVRSNE